MDLNNLSSAQQIPSKSHTRMHCYIPLNLYGKQQTVGLLLDAQHRNVTRRKGQVKKNRSTFRLLIGAVCYSADHELPFRGHDD